MVFVGRQAELAALEEWSDSSSARPALVWGRRRVGKTALLQRFAAQRRVVFHTGAGRPRAGELAELSRQAAALLTTGLRDLTTRPFTSWDEALEHLGDQARDRPLLVVLDEFPEIVASSPELPNVLRAFLDRAQGLTKLRLLVCGSAARTMQAIQEYRAPLYGRFDLTIHLHPFRPYQAAELLPDLAPEDLAVVYGVMGGMPLYLSWWDPGRSIAQNLGQLACRPDARMLTEGDFVLATEVGSSAHMLPVLHAIAQGRTRHNEIADAVDADPTRTLRDLTTLRLVERLQPVTESGRTRRVIYRICDNFLAFHLKVLARYRAEIDRGLGETIVPAVIEGLDDHMGAAWEEMFRDHLRRRAADLDPQVVAVGPWWSADGQVEIDAVALRGRSRVPFLAGEAKWARSVNASRIKAGLVRKSTALAGGVAELRYAVCGRTTVTHADPETVTITAADIFRVAD